MFLGGEGDVTKTRKMIPHFNSIFFNTLHKGYLLWLYNEHIDISNGSVLSNIKFHTPYPRMWGRCPPSPSWPPSSPLTIIRLLFPHEDLRIFYLNFFFKFIVFIYECIKLKDGWFFIISFFYQIVLILLRQPDSRGVCLRRRRTNA